MIGSTLSLLLLSSSSALSTSTPVDIFNRVEDELIDTDHFHQQLTVSTTTINNLTPMIWSPNGSSIDINELNINYYIKTNDNTIDSMATTINQTEKDYEVYYFYQTEQLTFLWIIFVMIVFGNCSVLGTLLLSKGRKSRMNFFIMNLAIADLLVGMINVLTDIVWRFTVGFYTGHTACKAIKFSQVMVTYGSTYVLVALSIDRYDAITHPLNFTSRERRAKFLIAFAWILSGLFSVPTFFLYKIHIIEDKPQCWIHLEIGEWQIYMTLVAISLFFIPTIIISACYSIIVYTIWTKSRSMGSSSKRKRLQRINGCSLVSGDSDNSGNWTNSVNNNNGSLVSPMKNESRFSGFESSDIDFKRMSSRGVIPRAKIKTVKMTLVIIFVFILCWSPYFVWDLLQVYQQIPKTQTTVAISTFIQSLAPLNSAANPLIYCLFSTHVAKNLRNHSTFLWLANIICFCLPRLYPTSNQRGSTVRSDTNTNTLTSTFTRSSGRTSLSLHHHYHNPNHQQQRTRNVNYSTTQSSLIATTSTHPLITNPIVNRNHHEPSSKNHQQQENKLLDDNIR
ncbi:cardioacceleratory peptide receptor-like [Panonychus citri]|uniref:cardioacceleratory peptide receptor-like n=1 Tax=Panonychus citri TaxID=50023 RepID=UPI002307D454|nr:cardioacceleratory peptide receptor-like [Panonychus citri]